MLWWLKTDNRRLVRIQIRLQKRFVCNVRVRVSSMICEKCRRAFKKYLLWRREETGRKNEPKLICFNLLQKNFESIPLPIVLLRHSIYLSATRTQHLQDTRWTKTARRCNYNASHTKTCPDFPCIGPLRFVVISQLYSPWRLKQRTSTSPAQACLFMRVCAVCLLR